MMRAELSLNMNLQPRAKLAPSQILRVGVVLLSSGFLINSYAGTTWDGGGADDNFGTGGNWNPDGAPPVGQTIDLTFDGSTRLTPFNNYTAFDDFHSLVFAATAGGFNVGGNAIDLFGKIENYSATTQTISLSALAINAGQAGTGEFNPVNGDLVINSANIFTNGNAIHIYGSNNRTVTFGAASIISQGGQFIIEQANTAVFQSAHTYTGDTIIKAGTLAFAAGGSADSSIIRIGDTVANSGAATVSLTATAGGQTLASTIVIRPSASGTQGVRTINSLNTSGTNTLSGGVFLDADLTTNIAGGGTLALTGSSIDLKNQTLTIGGAGNTSISGVIQNSTGSGKLTKVGSGTLTLSGANTFNGLVTINEGAVSVGLWNLSGAAGPWGQVTNGAPTTTFIQMNGGRINYTGASVSGDLRGVNLVSGNNTIDIISGSTLNFAGAFNRFQSNGGNLIKEGGGTLQIGSAGIANNIFTGKVVINNGALEWFGAGSMPSPGALVSDFMTINHGGVFQLTYTGAPTTVSANIGFKLSGTSGFTIEGNHTIAGAIADGASAGTLTKNGNGLLTLSGVNTYTGGTTISAGTLALSGAGAVPAQSAVNVSGATGVFNISGITAASTTIGSLSGVAGSGVVLGGKTLVVGGNNTATTFAGVASGVGGGITKVGTETLTMTGANSFSGSLIVANGTLSVNAWNNDNTNGPLGNSATAVTLGDATNMGTLRFTGGGSNNAPATIKGLNLAAGGGKVQMVYAGGNRGGNYIHINGSKISGSGGLTVDTFAGGATSRFIIVGSAPYTGPTVVAANSELQTNYDVAGDGTPFGAGLNGLGSAVTVEAGGLLTFFSFNNSRTIALGSLAGAGTVQGEGGGIHTFKIGGNDTNTTFSGILQNNGGPVALTKVGSGSLTLSGANVHTGATVVTNGILNLTGSLTGSSITVDGATANFTESATGIIAGGGTTFTINSGSATLAGANTFTGLPTLNGGVVTVPTWNLSGAAGPWGALANNPGAPATTLIQMNGGRINYTGPTAGGGLRGVNLASGNNTIDVIGGSTLTFGGGSNTFQSNGGNLIKEGAGTLQIGYFGVANNVFTGKVTINAGAVDWFGAGSMPNPGVLVPDFITINNNGIFQLSFPDAPTTVPANIGFNVAGNAGLNIIGNHTIAGVIADGAASGGITKTGSGILSAVGVNTYTGATSVPEGTLNINNWNLNGTNGGLGNSSLPVTLGSASTQGTLRYFGPNFLPNNDTKGLVLNAGGGRVILAMGPDRNSYAHLNGSSITGSGGLAVETGGARFLIVGSAGFTGPTVVAANSELQANYYDTGVDGTPFGAGTNGLGSPVTMNAGSALTLYSNAANTTVAIGSLSGQGIVRGEYLGTHTLKVGGDNSNALFSGIITDSFNTANSPTVLTKVGSGTQTLAGINTYSGATNINGGTLSLSGGGALADTTAINISAGAAFNISAITGPTVEKVGSLSGASGSVVQLGANTLEFGDLADTSFAGVIDGAGGGLKKVGTGTFTLNGTTTSTYSGSTSLTGGTLLLGHSDVLPDNAAFSLSGGTKFATGGFSDTTGSASLLGNAVIDLGGGSGSSVLTFANVDAWSGVLSVWNWNGTVNTQGVNGLNTRIIFNAGTLNGAQLADVHFYSGGDGSPEIGTGGGLISLGGGAVELVAVPEPAALGMAGLLVLLIGVRDGRQRHYPKTRS